MCLSHALWVLSKSTHQFDHNVPSHIPNGFFESLWENWTKLRILFDYIEINPLGTFWSDWWVLFERNSQRTHWVTDPLPPVSGGSQGDGHIFKPLRKIQVLFQLSYSHIFKATWSTRWWITALPSIFASVIVVCHLRPIWTLTFALLSIPKIPYTVLIAPNSHMRGYCTLQKWFYLHV